MGCILFNFHVKSVKLSPSNKKSSLISFTLISFSLELCARSPHNFYFLKNKQFHSHSVRSHWNSSKYKPTKYLVSSSVYFLLDAFNGVNISLCTIFYYDLFPFRCNNYEVLKWTSWKYIYEYNLFVIHQNYYYSNFYYQRFQWSSLVRIIAFDFIQYTDSKNTLPLNTHFSIHQICYLSFGHSIF
jgi:hypothetical protein